MTVAEVVKLVMMWLVALL